MRQYYTQSTLDFITSLATKGPGILNRAPRCQLENFALETLQHNLGEGWKEAIIANVCGFIHSPKKHGPDAFTDSGEAIEIKSESTFLAGQKKEVFKKLGGNAVFHCRQESDIDRSPPWLVTGGFHKSNLIYAICIPFDDEIKTQLKIRFLSSGKLTALKLSNRAWRYKPGLKLLYRNSNDLGDILTSEMVGVINRLSIEDNSI